MFWIDDMMTTLKPWSLMSISPCIAYSFDLPSQKDCYGKLLCNKYEFLSVITYIGLLHDYLSPLAMTNYSQSCRSLDLGVFIPGIFNLCCMATLRKLPISQERVQINRIRQCLVK